MSYRTEDIAYVQTAQAAAQTHAALHRSTAEYRALDAAHHIHPFSDMAALNRTGSRVIVKAKGVYLWDSDGNQVIDGMADLWWVKVCYGPQEPAAAAYTKVHGPPSSQP